MATEVNEFNYTAFRTEIEIRRPLFQDWADEIKWYTIFAGYLAVHINLSLFREAISFADKHLGFDKAINKEAS